MMACSFLARVNALVKVKPPRNNCCGKGRRSCHEWSPSLNFGCSNARDTAGNGSVEGVMEDQCGVWRAIVEPGTE